MICACVHELSLAKVFSGVLCACALSTLSLKNVFSLNLIVSLFFRVRVCVCVCVHHDRRSLQNTFSLECDLWSCAKGWPSFPGFRFPGFKYRVNWASNVLSLHI